MERGSERGLALAGAVALLAGAAPGRADGRAGVVHTLPPVIVEAVRPAELPEDPTSFTTVIDTSRYRGEGKSVEDMLGETVGVQVRRFGGPGQPAELSIRGSSGSQVVILLDGVRLNTAQSGSVDLSTLPASLVERIEVSRGGGSVQTGSDAIGGVVNVITRRARGTPTTDLVGAGGSFGTWQGSATQTGSIAGTELVAGYDGFKTDGDFEFQTAQVVVDGVEFPELVGSVERVNNRTENHSALFKLARDFGERVRVSVSDDFFYGSAGRPGPALGPGGEALQSRTAHQRRTRNLTDLSFEGADLFGSGVDASLRVFYRFDRSRYHDQDPPLGAPISSDNRNHSLGSRGWLERTVALGPSRQRGSLGLEYRRDWLDSDDSGDHQRDTVGVFAQDEADFFGERLKIVPALRFDHTDGFGSEWLPRLGLVVQPLSWLRFKGNVERSYRVPNFDELYFNEGSLRGNPSLDPEKAWNADLGFELGFDRLWLLDDVHLELAGFHHEIDESIVFQLVSFNVIAATNTGKARASGIELSGGLGLFDWLELSGNYTWLDSEEDNTGKALPGRAKDEYVLRAVVTSPGGLLKLVGERHHTGAIPVRAGGSSKIQSRSVYNASLTLDLAKWHWLPHWLPEWGRLRARRLAFSVIGTNLSDRSVRDALAFPQPGRTLLFQLEGGW